MGCFIGNYSWFTNANGGKSALKLDNFQLLDNSGNIIEQNTFTYATTSFSWDVTNPNYQNARDLWGFYNGATQNTDLIVPKSITFMQTLGGTNGNINIGGAVDRTIHSAYSQEGMLTRIDFPTAGYTTFTYENNMYDDNGTPTMAGGLRIKQIKSYDGTGASPITKTYKYGLSESGTGLANFASSQFNYMNTQLYMDTPSCSGGGLYATYMSRTFFSNTGFSYDSNPVMYPYVTEYFGDPATSTIGKVVYEFDSGQPAGDHDLIIGPSNKPYRDSYSWRRGKMSRKTTFDKNNNLVEDQIFNNQFFNATDDIVGVGAYQYQTQLQTACPGAWFCTTTDTQQNVYSNVFAFTSYSQSTGAVLTTQIDTYNYDSNNPTQSVHSTKINSYETAKCQLIQTADTHAAGNEQTVTVHRYPFQLSANSSSTNAAKGIFMLNTKNIATEPFETYTYLQNSDGSNQRVVSGEVKTYRQNASNTNYVVLDQAYILESPNTIPLASYVPASVNGTNNGIAMDTHQKLRISFPSYDEIGNVQEYSMVSDVVKSFQYGYNGALPVAAAVNAQNTIYNYTSTTNSTGIVGITMGGSGTTVSQYFSFTVDYTGTVSLKLGIPNSSSFTTTVNYSGMASGSSTLGTGCGVTVINFSGISPGTYTIGVTLTVSGGTSVGGCGEIDYPKFLTAPHTGGIAEFFYESFEESTNSQVLTDATKSHSGSRYLSGDFVTSFVIPNSRSYKVEYWYLDSNNLWQNISKAYTGSGMILSEGSAIEDVRIYPTDATLKSYVYDPVLGMTGAISETSLSTRYEYDTFGRLKLIKDDQGKILKTYQYHYRSQN